MDIRKRLFIIVGVVTGLVIVVVLGYRVFAPSLREQLSNEQNTGSKDVIGQIPLQSATTTATIPDLPVMSSDEAYLRQLARMVVEWAGSYSNQNNNSHLEALKPLVTDSLYDYLVAQAPTASREYAGVTTQVVVSAIKQKAATNAIIDIGVQEVVSGISSSTAVYKNGTVQLVEQNGVWRVNGIYWNK